MHGNKFFQLWSCLTAKDKRMVVCIEQKCTLIHEVHQKKKKECTCPTFYEILNL